MVVLDTLDILHSLVLVMVMVIGRSKLFVNWLFVNWLFVNWWVVLESVYHSKNLSLFSYCGYEVLCVVTEIIILFY